MCSVFYNFWNVWKKIKLCPIWCIISEYKIVMRFCHLSLNLCHDSSSYIASDEVQRIAPLTIFPARFCIVSICFRFSWAVLQNKISGYSKIVALYGHTKNVLFLVIFCLWDTLLKISKRLLDFLHI